MARKRNAQPNAQSSEDKKAMRDLTKEVNNDFQKIVLPTLGVIFAFMVIVIYFGTR